MPPCPPPRLRESFPFFSRRRAMRRVGFAVALGAVLILPSALHRDHGPKLLSVVQQCPVESAPTEDVTATVGSPDGGVARGSKLPERLPDEWMKAPCPEGHNMRTVRGRCFVSTGQQPPCSFGHEYSGECLLALTGAKPTPNSLER